MGRKDSDDSFWLNEHSDKRRLREAENARREHTAKGPAASLCGGVGSPPQESWRPLAA